MTTALIVVGVILFLAVDAFIVWRVLRASANAGRYGAMSVPGQATLTLPAGKVKVTYQEAVHTSGGGEGEISFYPPSDLDVVVAPVAGGQELRPDPGVGGSAETVAGFLPGGPRSRRRVGFLEVPAAGQYVVRATGSAADRQQPLVLLG